MARTVGGLDPQQRREQRRELLLDAALELFATRGYLESPIELLCQTAKVSTKSFYEVFDSREACYLGLMQRSTDHLKSAVTATYAALPTGCDEYVVASAVLGSLADTVAGDPRHAVILFGKGSATTPAVEQTRRANRRWAADFVSTIWGLLLGDAVDVPHGVVVGTVGGLFDLMADWVADAQDGQPADANLLRQRFAQFYAVIRAGLDPSSCGKEVLSKLV